MLDEPFRSGSVLDLLYYFSLFTEVGGVLFLRASSKPDNGEREIKLGKVAYEPISGSEERTKQHQPTLLHSNPLLFCTPTILMHMAQNEWHVPTFVGMYQK